jgi:penicillin amidase
LADRTRNAFGIARLALRLAWAGLRHRPRRRTVAERLSALPRRGLPVDAPVTIRWDEHLIPFIEARSDRDLAVALGLVHAHLRLAQMELMRRIAYGRVAEVAGPLAIPLDHALRLIDPGRAVPEIVALLPPATRDWLEGFVAGINHHIASDVEPPLEFRLLGIAAAPWSIADVVTLARLCAADVTWLVMARLLSPRAKTGAGWPEIWSRLTADGTVAMVPETGDAADIAAAAIEEIVLGSGRNGSNALAISGRRSATGRPVLAGDPHLMINLPSVWLAAAYKSPSYSLAGLMIPGVPVMAIGRNPFLAWGGTNLHAASSELFDVSSLPDSDITERRVRIAVRWARPRDIVLRETRHGPLVSDLPLMRSRPGEKLAMRWVGHAASDEISALLAINRARDAGAFARAVEGFAVPGQTLLVAERGGQGRIGRLKAAWLPRRAPVPPPDLVSPPDALAAWRTHVTSADFPAEIDPPSGFVVSANERPEPNGVPVGWFFSPGERAARMAVVLDEVERVGFADIAALQTDVVVAANAELRDRLCAGVAPPAACRRLFETLVAWDGRYEPGSAGALAFELVLARLAARLVDPVRRKTYGTVWHGRRLVARELAEYPPARLATEMGKALARANRPFRRLGTWGTVHRLRLAHPFAALPGIGRRYRHRDWPWPGSSESVLKSAHGPVTGRHPVGYGSNARYIFDMADPDGNHLVILGGQDGVPGSAAFLDQAELFRRGAYIAVPLRPETARARFPHCTVVEG